MKNLRQERGVSIRNGVMRFAVFILAGWLLGVPVLYAQNSETVELLKEKSAELLDSHQFDGLLSFLDEQRPQADEATNWLITYYEVMTKSLELDYLEQQEDWKQYYGRLAVFNPEIIDAGTAFVLRNPTAELSVYVQYFVWKAHLRAEDEMQPAAFDRLINLVVQQSLAQQNIALLKKIADTVRNDAGLDLFNQLYEGYTNSLSQGEFSPAAVRSLLDLADSYYQEKEYDTARATYRQALVLAEPNYSDEQLRNLFMDILGRFMYRPFVKNYDADFAESIIARIAAKWGEDSLGVDLSFGRALNLEMLGEYDSAAERYRQFYQRFPQHELAPEALTRAGLLWGYYLRDQERAREVWSELGRSFPDNPLASFSLYQAGLILQAAGEPEAAAEYYRMVANRFGAFSALADTRLREISEELPMDAALLRPLELHGLQTEDSALKVILDVSPPAAFDGQPVEFIGSAQDYSSGTIQPYFVFEWFGDLGGGAIPSQDHFSTSYDMPGPKVVWFSARAEDTTSIICRAAWIYTLSIDTPVLQQPGEAGAEIEFSAALAPALPGTDQMQWMWRIDGPESLVDSGRKIVHTFTAPGTYTVELTLLCEDTEIITRSFDFSIVAP